MSAIHRKITEMMVSINIQGEDKIETEKLKINFEVEGNSVEDIQVKTDKIRKKLMSGLDIYFTDLTDSFKATEYPKEEETANKISDEQPA